MKTIMVTGAGGYIGSVLVPKLLGKGYRVKAVDRFFFGTDKLAAHDHLAILREDTRKLTPALFEGVDAVIDLAAISNDPSGEWFQEETYQINYLSRVNTARMARQACAERYILPSSCSLYGYREGDETVDETSPLRPLTTYAKANEMAERGVLQLADDRFAVVVARQATVYGRSPRMRFDLAVNAMTCCAWERGVIPLNRDGSQWRPFVHVQDTTDAMILLLEAEPQQICGEIFNIGSSKDNYRLSELAAVIAKALPVEAAVEWYGDADRRSYRVNCDKIARALNWQPRRTVGEGVREIYDALSAGKLARSAQTMTLQWYQELSKWHKIVKEREMHGGMIQL